MNKTTGLLFGSLIGLSTVSIGYLIKNKMSEQKKDDMKTPKTFTA